jgi:hypothetical protein
MVDWFAIYFDRQGCTGYNRQQLIGMPWQFVYGSRHSQQFYTGYWYIPSA